MYRRRNMEKCTLGCRQQLRAATAQPESERVTLVTRGVGGGPEYLPGCSAEHKNDNDNNGQIGYYAAFSQQSVPQGNRGLSHLCCIFTRGMFLQH